MPISPEQAWNLAAPVADVYAEAERLLLARIASSIAQGIDAPEWVEKKLLETQLLQRAAARVLLAAATRGEVAATAAVVAAWNRGDAQAVLDLARITEPGLRRAATVQPSLNAIVRELVGSLQQAHQRTLRAVPDVYRDVVRRAAPQILVGTQTRRQAAQRALDDLGRRGITGFTDRRGRQWQLDSYVEMATRAATGRAAVDGHVTRLAARGFDLVYVSDAPQECHLCLVPGTVVEGPVPTGRTRSEYRGDVVSITTAGGKNLTGTPDHPVLVEGLGWTPLERVRPGHKVVSHDREKGYPGVVPDDVQVPTLIEHAGEAWLPVLATGPTRRDLDQDVAYREIRDPRPDLYLLAELHTSLGKPLRDELLVSTVGASSSRLGGGDRFPGLIGAGYSAVGLMGGSGPGSTLFGSGRQRTSGSGLTGGLAALFGGGLGSPSGDAVVTRPSGYPRTPEVVGNAPAADAVSGSHLLGALSGYVTLDEVVSVGVRQFAGHVWDLSTEPAWLVAGGIVTHNCRPWEGKVLATSGPVVPPAVATLDAARAAGLLHPGCRHSTALYLPGISKLPTDTADPQGDRDRQRLRALERNVRAAKRVEAVALDDEARAKARRDVRRWQAAIREHVATTSAKRVPARERIGVAH